jgi:hypothetical protein
MLSTPPLPSVCGSATTYGRSEDVRIVPIVVSEFEFRDIQRQIFTADFVELPTMPRFNRSRRLSECGQRRQLIAW